MKFIFLVLANVMIIHWVCSQNLVIDPGFEKAKHGLQEGSWMDMDASVDLWETMHPEKNRNFGLCRKIAPYEGNQILGLGLINFDVWNCRQREFVIGKLSQTLKPGRTYKVSVKARMSDASGNMFLMTDIGVLFSENQPSRLDVCADRVNYLPLRADSKYISANSQWQHIENNYTAKGGEQFITLGGFLGASYKSIIEDTDVQSKWAYFFFDLVEVIEIEKGALPIENENKLNEDNAAIESNSRILFDYNSSLVQTEYQNTISKIATHLRKNENLQIELTGHTDTIGGDNFNERLSEDRAEAVKKMLVDAGAPPQRIRTLALGSKVNITSNRTEPERQANRRVVIHLFYQNALTNEQLDAIQNFARIYGYVRFFYPRDLEKQLDWNLFAAYACQQLRQQKDKESLLNTLQDLFKLIAPAVSICATDQACGKNISATDNDFFWQHEGLACGGNEVYQSELVPMADKAKWIFDQSPNSRKITAQGTAGIQYEVPLILPLVTAKLNNKIIAFNKQIKAALILDQDKYLANTIIAWNLIQHFYPYIDYLQLDWPAHLRPFLEEATDLRAMKDFSIFIKKVSAKIQDGHSTAHHNSNARNMWLPFETIWQQGELVVTQSGHDRIKQGDIIKKIDGQKAIDLFSRDSALISGSSQWKSAQARKLLGVDKFGSVADLDLKRGKLATKIAVKREWGNFPETDLIREVGEEIFYIDLKNVTDVDSLIMEIKMLSNVKGLVFDVRGYLYFDLTKFLAHLITEPDTVNNWIQTPLIVNPDQQFLTFKKEGWEIDPAVPKLNGQYVFLTDANAISASESFMAFVKHYQLGKIIGGPTAGANGSKNWMKLLLGYSFGWTGMYVTDLAGDCYHNKGIIPDIPILENDASQDLALARAIQIISEKE